MHDDTTTRPSRQRSTSHISPPLVAARVIGSATMRRMRGIRVRREPQGQPLHQSAVVARGRDHRCRGCPPRAAASACRRPNSASGNLKRQSNEQHVDAAGKAAHDAAGLKVIGLRTHHAAQAAATRSRPRAENSSAWLMLSLTCGQDRNAQLRAGHHLANHVQQPADGMVAHQPALGVARRRHASR